MLWNVTYWSWQWRAPFHGLLCWFVLRWWCGFESKSERTREFSLYGIMSRIYTAKKCVKPFALSVSDNRTTTFATELSHIVLDGCIWGIQASKLYERERERESQIWEEGYKWRVVTRTDSSQSTPSSVFSTLTAQDTKQKREAGHPPFGSSPFKARRGWSKGSYKCAPYFT